MSRSATGSSTQAAILAASYLCLFAYIGIYLPWFPPMLGERGFDARMIGFALALVSVSRIVLPPAWGLLADRLRARRTILFACSLLAGLAMIAQAAPHGPGARMAWLFVHGFFLVPLFPLMDAVTLGILGSRADQYGRIRLWGSIGFITASLGFGTMARRAGTDLVPWAAGLPLVATALLVPLLRAPGETSAAGDRAAPSADRSPMPWRLLVPLILAAACGQASHGPYYAFFTLQMEARGLAPHWIGSLWAWGVLCEVALMALSPLILRRVRLVAALRLALVLTAIRWAIYASEPPVAAIVAGQALHAASFGLLHVASVRLVGRVSPEGRRVLGQSVLSACAYGGGIGSGLFLSGLLIERLGDGGLYAAAAALAVAGLAVSAGIGTIPGRDGWHGET